ncbi:MAG: PIN domain-containing protein [Lachnospiraceae bacterium]|nr:PIN domain-containing protein [Lachnospiraceae bacterium]MDD7326818.1 PIN domain-containing protein [Lachnospiraceae bacterium]MDY2758652.1 PIN domain-containing protein [Lachnospiraceae bacterium]
MSELNDLLNGIPDADTYVLVDSENVASVWLDRYDQLVSEGGEASTFFIVFYTDKTPNMNYDDVFRFMECTKNGNMAMIRCNRGEKAASALDFQLVSVAGYLIAKKMSNDPDSENGSRIEIFSKDKGYDPMVQLWADAGYQITRAYTLDMIGISVSMDGTVTEMDTDLATEDEKRQARDAFMASILPEEDTKARNTAKTLMATYLNGTITLQEMYLQLLKQFGQERGISIYHAIKPHFEEFRQFK